MTAEHGRRPDREPDAYWQEDVAIGEVEYQQDHYPLWMRLHQATEEFRADPELTPLEHPRGERLYVHAKPYVMVPDYRLTVALDEPARMPQGNGAKPPEARRIGTVLSSERMGWRSRDLGNAQGWCYPEDRLIMIWECYLEDWCRRPDPTDDPLLWRVWEGFEGRLIASLPEAERILTPSWEDLYGREDWQVFLMQQGYQPMSDATYSKRIDGDERAS